MYKKKVVERCSFPSVIASDSEKESEDYGLKYAKAIESEWFKRPSGNGKCGYYDKMTKFHDLRLYSRGEQSVKLYKDVLAGGRDTSYTQYDWRPLQIIPKFVKLIVNQMMDRLYEIKVDAIDSYSTDLKDQKKKYLEDVQASQPVAKMAKEILNVDINPSDYDDLPQSQEEIDLHMSLNFKLPLEIAAEEALRAIHSINDFDESQSLITEDVTVLGVGAGKQYLDPTKGFVMERVDPATMIWSFPKRRDFKDVYYYGEVESNVPIHEVVRRSRGKVSEYDLEDLANISSNWSSYHDLLNTPQINEDNIEGTLSLLHFTFKTTKNLVYKKKNLKTGGFKMIKKDENFIGAKSKQNDSFEVINKKIEVWYEGTLVLGTDILIDYGLAKNMIRPKGLLNITYPKYSIYAPEMYQGRIKSTVDRVIPYVDQMQLAHMKLQQMVAKARPSGVFIDIAGLNEVDMGNGNILTPLEQMRIYDDTGNIIGTSLNDEGEFNYGKSPITELNNGIVQNIEKLIGVYNHYLGLVRDAIGIPQGADASMPHPDTLVGVQQQVALNSNTATRHILDSTLFITRTLMKGVSLRLNDMFDHPDIEAMFVNTIGKLNVEALRSNKDQSLTDLGIIIDLKLDAQEKQLLENNINQALQTGAITMDDANDIRLINNLKLANQLLKTRRIRREKEQRAHELERDTKMQESQARLQEQTNQAKAENEIRIAQAKESLERIKGEESRLTQENEGKIKERLMEKEFTYNMYLKGAELNVAKQTKAMEEDRKDKRQAMQSSFDSQKIDQRQNNGAPIDFTKQTNTDDDMFSVNSINSMAKGPAINPSMNQGQMDNIRNQSIGDNFESANDYVSGDMGIGSFEP